MDHGEAHHVVQSSGEGPEVVRRWKGGASVENVNGDRRSEARSGQVWAQSSSWRVGTGAGRSKGARGMKDSSGGGEGWPEQRRRRALLTLLGTSSKKEKKGRGK